MQCRDGRKGCAEGGGAGVANLVIAAVGRGEKGGLKVMRWMRAGVLVSAGA